MSHITEIETLASQLADVDAPMTEIQIMIKSSVHFLQAIETSQLYGTVYQYKSEPLLSSHHAFWKKSQIPHAGPEVNKMQLMQPFLL